MSHLARSEISSVSDMSARSMEHGSLDPMAVFAPVRSLDVRSLAGPALEVPVAPGAHLLEEHQVTGTFYVIRAGEAELWQGGRKLRLLGIGDCFGEIDPVVPTPQRYTVIASGPMRVLTFSAFGIGRLCATVPSIRARILSFLPDSGVPAVR
jgi:CRP-like cAMP-binding protein